LQIFPKSKRCEMNEVTTDQLKIAITEMIEAEKQYLEAKKVSSAFNAVYDEKYAKVIELLEATGMEKFSVPGIADVTKMQKLKVTTPKDSVAKTQFFGWLMAKYSDDWLNEVTVNYATLNRIYNEAYEATEDKALFSIPGIEAPTLETSLRVSRK